MIDILVPVLGRPGNAQPLVESVVENTVCEWNLTFIYSVNDEAEGVICEDLSKKVRGVDAVRAKWEPGPADYARKINAGYGITNHPFIFTAADDIEFTPGWDTAALEVAERTGAGMIGTNDDANPLVKRGKHSTHTLFRRSYIDEIGATFFDGPGVVFCEQYRHQWVDTEAVKAAQDRGQWAFARRSVVRHHHPFYDKTVALDDTYRKALGDASHDSALYRQRLQDWTRQRRATVL